MTMPQLLPFPPSVRAVIFQFVFFMVFITSVCSRMCQRQPGKHSARHGDSPHLCAEGEMCLGGLYLLEQNPEVDLCSQGRVFKL